MKPETSPTLGGIGWVWLITLLACALFTATPLAFTPVPWPDGTAFYLPGVDLWSWPPRWQMASQAAFVPEYLEANFNTMPLLPLALGFLSRLGLSDLIGPLLVTRLFSLFGLALLVHVFWKLTRKSLGLGLWTSFTLTLALLWDPVLRWGTLVVRTETWVGIAWVMIVRQLLLRKPGDAPAVRSRSLWVIAGWLAAAAYTHFEAIVWVPAVAVALWPVHGESISEGARNWFRECLEIAARTIALLSPWLIYALYHWGLFWRQMEIQFSRLAQGNSYFQDAYSIFHNLFLSLGNPGGWPKLFNLGKAFFWVAVVGLLLQTLFATVRAARSGKGVTPQLPVLVGSAIAFLTTYALWFRKPEVWFITLCHIALWTGFAVALSFVADLRVRRAWVGLAGAFAIISVATTAIQAREIPSQYSWTTYHAWIDCIDRTIRLGVKDSATRPDLKIWQPHVPDALIELRARRPTYELTRALDFPVYMERARQLSGSIDALILSRHAPVETTGSAVPVYEGAERLADMDMLNNTIEVPFGTWALESGWRRQICHHGPFWASIAFR